MSYLVVNKDADGPIEIDFGVYYTNGILPFKKAMYSCSYAIKSHLMEDHILVWGEDIRTFEVIAPGGSTSKGLIVESVNGVTPTDLDHLFELIKVLF